MRKFVIWVLVLAGLAGLMFNALLSEAGNCNQLEANVREVIAGGQCETNADCTVLNLTCPFDCFTPVERSLRSEVYAALNEYNSNCLPTCPDCPKTPAKAVCINNRCSLAN